MFEMNVNSDFSPESVDCCLSEWNSEDFGSNSNTNMTGIGSFDHHHHLEHQQPNSILHIQNPIRDTALFREKTEFSDVLLSIKASHTHYNPHHHTSNSITTKFPQNGSNNYPSQLFTSHNYSPSSPPIQSTGWTGCNPGGSIQAIQQQNPTYHHQPNFVPNFPTAASMSVNVQMNMTMGYLNPHTQLDHQHHQWSNQNHPQQSNAYSGNSVGNFNPGNCHYQQGTGYQHYNLDFCPADINCDHPFGPNRPTQWTSSLLSPTHISPTHQSNISQGNSNNHNHNSATTSPICSSGGFNSRNNDQGIPPLGSKKFYQTRITRSSTIGSISSTPESLSNRVKLNLCRVCGKSYARPSTLKTHLRTHSGEKPYKCDECYKSFSQAANLTAHARTHSGEKPFRCLVCERRFSQSSSVTTHMRTHSGERPYRCKLCKKAFSDSSTLTKHNRIHSGEKPYSCKICLLRFSQSGNLNRHSRVHTNNMHLN